MEEPTSDKHFEDEYESSLLKAIRKRAEERDISYGDAANEIVADYDKDLSFENTEVEDAAIKRTLEDMAEVRERKLREKGLK